MSDDSRSDSDPGLPQPHAVAGFASDDDLKREQLRLTNEKLRVETRKLANEIAPQKWWLRLTKDVVALGGIFTVLATGYGLYDSYHKTLDDRERARATEQHAQDEERRIQFENAVKKLESQSAISKMIAVSVLSGYLTKEDSSFHRQILFTFASVVATERDLQTQAAILDLMTAQDTAAIAPKDWSYFQSMLVSQSRALVARTNLYRKRQFGLGTITPNDDEIAARHVGNLIAVNIRRKVVPDFGAYAGMYCEACNFRYTKFPAGADFTGAILDRADFRGATVEGAVFDNAELEGAVFAQAYLKNASFQTVPAELLMDGVGATADDVTHIQLSTPYLQHVLQLLVESQRSIKMTMPDFSCANLQGAHFDNLSIFGITGHGTRKVAPGDNLQEGWHASLSEQDKRKVTEGGTVEILGPLTVTPPSFFRADLNGAHLEDMRVFSLGVTSDSSPYRYLDPKNWTSSSNSDLALREGKTQKNFLLQPPSDPSAAPIPNDYKDSDRSALQKQIRLAFFSVDFSTVHLPDGFIEVAKDGNLDGVRQSAFENTYPKSGLWDWPCSTTARPFQ